MSPAQRALGVIPARLGSTRLPRKPLHLLVGKPLLEWVWRRVMATELFDAVVVATDSDEVADAARGFGATVEMTDPSHPSGTDRVAEIAGLPEFADYPFIVNIQGDEPFVRHDHLAAALTLVRDLGWEIGTVASRIETLEDWRSPSVVKVVRGDDGGALIFSRAPIPFMRDAEPAVADLSSGAFLRHIGIYSYRRDALLAWVARPVAGIEAIEKLEQLRPLAAGARIGVEVVETAEAGVDTPEDAARAERILRSQLEPSRLPAS